MTAVQPSPPLRVQLRTLELMARGADLQETLDAICVFVEEEAAPKGSVTSVMRVQEDGNLVAIAAPNLPSFVGAVLTPGPGSGSCGNAAHRCEAQFVQDTLEDERWSELQTLAQTSGIRSCWSIPILDGDGKALATFAISGFQPGLPTSLHEETLRIASALVSLALERDASRQEREHLEKQLRLARHLEGLGRLAGGVAHDFNNLLQVVVGNAELVSLDTEDPAQQERLDLAIRAATSGAALCHQILDYAGRGQTTTAPLDLSAIARETVDLCRCSAQGTCPIEAQIEDGLHVVGDSSQLQQLIQNLLLNALEAAGQTGTVTLDVRAADLDARALKSWDLVGTPGEVVQITVSDTGPGIEPGIRDRLFNPFVSTKGEGRGLGLAAALGILHGHEGSLHVRDATPGAQFRVALPRAAAPAADVEASQTDDSQGSLRVLVVDDEPEIRKVVESLLKRDGHTVTLASDGQEALDWIQAHRDELDLVVLDLSMPRLGGEELLTRLGADPVPVLVSSGRELASDFASTPWVGFLPKPHRLHQLRAAVRDLLSRPDS